MAYAPDGSLRTVADRFVFCNGIVIDGDGELVVTEANGLMRIFSDGTKQWIIENLSDQHAADGLAVDMNGVLYLAGSLDHGIRVVDGDREVDFWPIPGEGATTNCCFGGPDGTSDVRHRRTPRPGRRVARPPDAWKDTDPVARGAGVTP